MTMNTVDGAAQRCVTIIVTVEPELVDKSTTCQMLRGDLLIQARRTDAGWRDCAEGYR